MSALSLSLSLSNKTIDFVKESYPEQGFLNNIADFLKESYPDQGFLFKIIEFLKESDPEQGVKGLRASGVKGVKAVWGVKLIDFRNHDICIAK